MHNALLAAYSAAGDLRGADAAYRRLRQQGAAAEAEVDDAYNDDAAAPAGTHSSGSSGPPQREGAEGLGVMGLPAPCLQPDASTYSLLFDAVRHWAALESEQGGGGEVGSMATVYVVGCRDGA